MVKMVMACDYVNKNLGTTGYSVTNLISESSKRFGVRECDLAINFAILYPNIIDELTMELYIADRKKRR